MGRIETFKQETRERRQSALLEENGKLVELNARLGIQSTLQTTMPTTGVGAFIGVSTGHAVVRIDQLEWLADQIAEARQLGKDLAAMHDSLAERNTFLEGELARWHRIDGQAEL